MSFHVVAPCESLPAQGAQVSLRSVYGRVVPPVADSLAAHPTPVQHGRFGYPVEQVAVVPCSRAAVIARRLVVWRRKVRFWLMVGRLRLTLFPPTSWNRESQPSPSNQKQKHQDKEMVLRQISKSDYYQRASLFFIYSENNFYEQNYFPVK